MGKVYDVRCEFSMSVNGMVRPCSCPTSDRMLGRGAKDKEHDMSQKFDSAIAVIGIDIGKNWCASSQSQAK